MFHADVLACVLAACLTVYIYSRSNRQNHPLPPGPKKLPIIGNLLDIPSKFEWMTYAQWGKQFNWDFFHLSAFGNDIIVVNSFDVANDLLDKRSAIYSSRAGIPMVNDLMGYDWLFVFQPYGNKWRERRGLFQKHFPLSDTRIHRFNAMEHVQKLLPRILDSPENLLAYVEHMVGGMAISIAYGLDAHQSDDPFIRISKQAIEYLNTALVQNVFLVNFIPALKYIPEYFPGAGFKRKAKEWSLVGQQLKEVPFMAAEKAMVESKRRPSFVSLCLDKIGHAVDTAHQREVIKDTAATFFIAGYETTSSTIHTFILAMMCHPEIQKKAQEEIDTVIGHGRLPDFNDEEQLPYLSAIVKEVLRWRPVTPIGVPHYMVGDDVYNGYYFPKNSIIIANIWAMLHNERDYPDPDSFNPERFLKDGKLNPLVKDPATVAFGFGRRICPGSAIALSTIWYTVAALLSTFNISNAIDENRREIKPTVEYVSGMASHPAPFKCVIKPRSSEEENLIRSLED